MNVHLWWNGYEHSVGVTEEDASRWLQTQSGEAAEECEGDGWQMVPDDVYMYDEENTGPDGRCVPTGETAQQYAESMLAMAAPRPTEDGR